MRPEITRQALRSAGLECFRKMREDGPSRDTVVAEALDEAAGACFGGLLASQPALTNRCISVGSGLRDLLGHGGEGSQLSISCSGARQVLEVMRIPM